MPKFKAQEVAASMRKVLQTPDLPDDLRARYKRILDAAELREILVNAQALTLARMRAEAQAETQDAAPSHAPSERTKETR